MACARHAYASVKALFIYLKIFLYFRSSDESHVTFDVDSFTKALDRILGEIASLFETNPCTDFFAVVLTQNNT